MFQRAAGVDEAYVARFVAEPELLRTRPELEIALGHLFLQQVARRNDFDADLRGDRVGELVRRAAAMLEGYLRHVRHLHLHVPGRLDPDLRGSEAPW